MDKSRHFFKEYVLQNNSFIFYRSFSSQYIYYTDKGKRRADEQEQSNDFSKKGKLDYSSEEDDTKWPEFKLAIRESRNIRDQDGEQKGESSKQSIPQTSKIERTSEQLQIEQTSVEPTSSIRQSIEESTAPTEQTTQQPFFPQPVIGENNNNDDGYYSDPDRISEVPSQWSESEDSDSYMSYGSERDIHTDDETQAFADGMDGEVRKMSGVWDTLENSEIGDYRRANFLHGNYFQKLKDKQSRYADCMEDTTRTISNRRWFKGRHVAVSEFLNDVEREKALDEELFVEEQQETDPGLGKDETPPPNNNDSDDDDNNNNGGPSMGGSSGPDSGSPGDNHNTSRIMVISFIGYICDAIVEFITQVPM